MHQAPSTQHQTQLQLTMVPRCRAMATPLVAWALGIAPRVAQARMAPFRHPRHLVDTCHFATTHTSATMGKQQPVTMEDKYVLGNDGTPFYTREVRPLPAV